MASTSRSTKFDHRLGCVVAVTESRLHDAGIAAIALLVARTDDIKELLHLRDIADFRDRLPAGVQPAFLGQRHQLLDDRT